MYIQLPYDVSRSFSKTGRMRIAVLSDIHGNRTAFEAVLADIRQVSPDLVLFGGDLADGGSSPVEIIDRLRDLGWAGVIGNTDEMLSMPETFEEFAGRRPHLNALWSVTREMAGVTREWLGEERLMWLRHLPRTHLHASLALVHASPDTPWSSPTPEAGDAELESVYGGLGFPIAVYGHIHLPYVRSLSKMIVANCGSVGMTFDGDRRASYLLVDGTKVSLRRVEYDVDREIKTLLASGLPHARWIARILETGAPQLP
jgi:predicted phosphodiesterase